MIGWRLGCHALLLAVLLGCRAPERVASSFELTGSTVRARAETAGASLGDNKDARYLRGLGEWLGRPELDGVASILIGCILAGAAVVLATETKALLIGEGARPEDVAEIRRVLLGHDAIVGVNEILAMHQGPDDILVNVSVEFRDGLAHEEVERHIATIEREIKARLPGARRLFIEAQSAADHFRDRAAHAYR